MASLTNSDEAYLHACADLALAASKEAAKHREVRRAATARGETLEEISRAEQKLDRLRARLAQEPENPHIGPAIEKARVRIAGLKKMLETLPADTEDSEA